MIKKRAKREAAERLVYFMDGADIALCDAARTNVLTGTSDRRLRDLIHVVRRFREDAQRAIDERMDAE